MLVAAVATAATATAASFVAAGAPAGGLVTLGLVAAGAQRVPLGAELVELVAGGVAGLLVAHVEVQRRPVVGDLSRAVVALQRAQLRRLGALARLRVALGRVWRPHLGALAVAVGLIALVLLEQVERSPLRVDQDRSELRIVGGGHRGRPA